MKGSRHVKLTLKNTRRMKNQQHYPLKDESVKDTATNAEGWFERSDLAGDRQDTRKKQLLDHKRNKLPSNGSKSRDNPLSAVRGTTRRLFVLGGKIILLTLRILMRFALYFILYSTKNPRKASPLIFAFLIIAYISKGVTRTSAPKPSSQHLFIHDPSMHGNYTLPQENFSVGSLPNTSQTMKPMAQEKEEQERQELLKRLSDKLINPITPKDSQTGIEASGNDISNEELLKLLGSLMAQANTAQLQMKGSKEDLEEEGGISSYSQNFHIQQRDSSKENAGEKLSPPSKLNSQYLQEMTISMQQAAGRKISVNDTDTNSFDNFTVVNKTDLEFYVAVNASNEIKEGFTEITVLKSLNQSESMVDAVSLPKLFDRLENIRDTYKNKKRLFRRTRNVPYFWYIPLAGGLFLEKMFSKCWDLVQASDVELHFGDMHDFSLHVIRQHGNKYINLDVTTSSGINQAKNLKLAASGKVDVVVSPALYDTADIFTTRHKGVLFGLFHHPIQRSIAMFYHFKSDTNDPSYQSIYSNMTLEDYASHGYAENNYLTRFLSNKMGGKVDYLDLAIAKKILKEKCVIGLYSEFEKSVHHFEQYFKWNSKGDKEKRERCIQQLVDKVKEDSAMHNEIRKGSKEWSILARHNMFDLELYDYITSLFSP